MKLTIVIVNWNTCKLLEGCLTSIFFSPCASDFEVFVIDNASSDDSVQLVKRNFPHVVLIENLENLGFARANNQAIRQSAGRYILLLNPDTQLKPGVVDTLINFMDANPDTGAAGPRLINPDGTLQISAFPKPTLFRELWRLFHLDSLYPYSAYPVSSWRLDHPKQVDVLMGACLILRREILDQIGLLDEDYYIYSEEVDLCYRIKQARKELYWVPGAEVVHFGAQSTEQVAGEMFLHLYRSKVLYFRKHNGPAACWIYKLILCVASISRLILTPIALIERTPQRHKHLSLSQHYCRLILELPGL